MKAISLLFALLTLSNVACGPMAFTEQGQDTLNAIKDGPVADNGGNLSLACAEGEAVYLRGDWTQDGALTEEDYLLALAQDAPENALLLSCPAVADLDGNGKVERIGGISYKSDSFGQGISYKGNKRRHGHAWGKRCRDEHSDSEDLFKKFRDLREGFAGFEIGVICQSDCALAVDEPEPPAE